MVASTGGSWPTAEVGVPAVNVRSRCVGAGQGCEPTGHGSTSAFPIPTFAANGSFHFPPLAGLGRGHSVATGRFQELELH